MCQVRRAWQQQRSQKSPSGGEQQQQGIVEGVAGLIGNTPLLRIPSLSKQTGCEVGTCSMQHVHSAFSSKPFLPLWLSTSANNTWPAVAQILAKAEFLNPGGSVKDRVALTIVKEAIDAGDLKPGGLITEGTAGSTGVLSCCSTYSTWGTATQSAAANAASPCALHLLCAEQAVVAACQHQGAQKFECPRLQVSAWLSWPTPMVAAATLQCLMMLHWRKLRCLRL